MADDLDRLCVNTIRTLSIDAVQKADSGHPGLPLGAAPMGYVLWQRHLKHDPGAPEWPDRDRFVLSAGHGSMLLYSLLHLAGYDLSMDDLRRFRQWESRTPGHPEHRDTPGVEATTGPLGQGTANSVGMAIAERALAHRFNRPGHEIVDHRTYALVSDGDLMEGVSAEAASLAGHLGLGKLTWLYDSNEVSLDGPASLSFSREDVAARFAAYGWHVQTVEHGDHDLDALDAALHAAREEARQPSLIVVRTTIGFGSPHKAGKSDAHGSPLGEDEVRLTKQALGFDPDRHFHVPAEARTRFLEQKDNGEKARADWEARFAGYAQAHPDLAAEWTRRLARELPDDFEAALPVFEPGKGMATRTSGGKVLNALAQKLPELIGGDADLSVSTKTGLKDLGSFDGRTGAGRNLHFGVREHAMAGIANGMSYHGGVRPFTATFFVFSDYLRPSLRLAALARLPVVHVYTHDSIGVGEDGPTHEPVEHLASLRAMPNLHVVRPCDANEAAEAWRHALLRRDGPTALVLSRQDLATLDRSGPHASAAGLRRGAYVLAEARGGPPGVVLIATGSEVHLALAARARLEEEGVPTRVVSMPSFELFEEWCDEHPGYRGDVLPDGVPRVAVEAGSPFGWHRHVGSDGTVVGLRRFGASAPGDVVMEKLGFTVEHVVAAARLARAASG